VRVSESAPGREAGTGSVMDPNGIELRLPARLEHLPIIRSVAANLAIRADFDLDSIADLKLAVDEACSTVITRAVQGSTLSCVFLVNPDEILFSAVAPSAGGHEPSSDSFGWRVLTTLADHVAAWVEEGESTRDGKGLLVRIELTKRKTSGA
jgi:serine/threonine-protein kinase RsbW